MSSDKTRAVRAGLEHDTQFGAVVPAIHLSSNFTFAEYSRPRLYDYTRSGNPTRDLLGCALAELEEGEGAVVTSTGTSAVLLAVSVLRPDDLLVAPHDCYGGTFRLFTALAERGHFRVTFVDLTDEAQLAEALEQKPALLWVETPSNPLLRITDLRDVTTTAHRVGARVVVDNTFLSPALQKPIALGADVVVHSTTKYINGHSDVVGGALVAREAAVHQEYAWWANCLGVTGAPFDSYLTLRGLRTLHARFRVHEENARAVAELLRAHPAVERVFYPGLEEHPGHALAASQQRGFGGMVSFELRGGTEAVRAYLQGLRHFSLAESLGGVESLVAHPATMTHASMTPEARARAGIRDSLLRLSIGIEAAEDLVADVAAGLERAERSTEVRAIRAVR
ncbi:MAG: cystathionine gamma-synthase [Myxococcaceae bacterium]|nr:cystathionine gamma-synthase [Myxococcaceae bacterium]